MNTEKLTDQSKMLFGFHKGKTMDSIPAKYFHYMWTTNGFNKIKRQPDTDNQKSQHQINSELVADYIRDSLQGLAMEEPDLIW